MDAFSAYERMPLSVLRDRARAVRSSARVAFLARAIVIRIADDYECTNATIEFLWCKLRCTNPRCALQVRDDYSLLPFAKMTKMHCAPRDVNAATVSYVAGFFLGRVLARRRAGSIRIKKSGINTIHAVLRILILSGNPTCAT